MATFLESVRGGGAKKAFAGTFGALAADQIVSPFVDWGFVLIQQNGLDVPDPVELATKLLAVAAVGFLVSFFSPANNIETERGALVKPEDAKITKA